MMESLYSLSIEQTQTYDSQTNKADSDLKCGIAEEDLISMRSEG